MDNNYQALTRVDLALNRLGLLNKSCDYIRTATGMDVPHTTDPGFSRWLSKLDKLPIKPPRYNKRKLNLRKKDKAAQARIYYQAHKKSKIKSNSPPQKG